MGHFFQELIKTLYALQIENVCVWNSSQILGSIIIVYTIFWLSRLKKHVTTYSYQLVRKNPLNFFYASVGDWLHSYFSIPSVTMVIIIQEKIVWSHFFLSLCISFPGSAESTIANKYGPYNLWTFLLTIISWGDALYQINARMNKKAEFFRCTSLINQTQLLLFSYSNLSIKSANKLHLISKGNSIPDTLMRKV